MTPERLSDRHEATRQLMLQRHLRGRGIADAAVLQAMATVPREAFVDLRDTAAAYDDRALPLSHGQTISQPYTVAFMCEAMQLSGDEIALEVGTGSGYAAAVLSQLAHTVHTIERVPELAESARERLQQLGYDNVFVHQGDGTRGLPSEAPFDAIVVTAGGNRLPPAYVEQLSEGGRIVIPLQDRWSGQRMHRFTWHSGQLHDEDLGRFAFVPLIGEFGWPN